MRTSPAASHVLPCAVLPHLALTFLSLLVDSFSVLVGQPPGHSIVSMSASLRWYRVHLGWVKGWYLESGDLGRRLHTSIPRELRHPYSLVRDLGRVWWFPQGRLHEEGQPHQLPGQGQGGSLEEPTRTRNVRTLGTHQDLGAAGSRLSREKGNRKAPPRGYS